MTHSDQIAASYKELYKEEQCAQLQLIQENLVVPPHHFDMSEISICKHQSLGL